MQMTNINWLESTSGEKCTLVISYSYSTTIYYVWNYGNKLNVLSNVLQTPYVNNILLFFD
jgi:hypothetical protein